MQQQITESSKKTPPGGLGGSENRLLGTWKSGANQYSLMSGWGALVDIIKHQGTRNS